MEATELIFTSVSSVALGFVSSWLFLKNQKSKEKKIRQKIAELEYQEKLIESINNGYKNLLRHAFKSISFSLFLVFSALTAILGIKLIQLPEIIAKTIWLIAVPACGVAAAICFALFQDIVKLNDIDSAKKQIQDKKGKLENKL